MAKPPRHRYSIGIDLGTSNCALAYVDLREKDPVSRILEVPQWVASGRSDVSRLLPSFAYYPPGFQPDAPPDSPLHAPPHPPPTPPPKQPPPPKAAAAQPPEG